MAMNDDKYAEIKGRITVVGNVYLQQPGEETTCVESRFVKTLQSDEQPYKRRVIATQEWKKLETGWLGSSKLGMLVLLNEEGLNLQKVPTKDEKEDMASRVIEVGVATLVGEPGKKTEVVVPAHLIPPGQDERFFPYDIGNFRIRCQNGTAKCMVNALPI